MTERPVVADASPLIALSQIDCLHLLRKLFDIIYIPPAVAREVAPSVTLPEWILQKDLVQEIGPTVLRFNLGLGESEAITLALELAARRLILDDRPARRLAQALHIPIIGTLGILIAARRKELIPAVGSYLDTLLDHDFRISRRLYQQVLADANESS